MTTSDIEIKRIQNKDIADLSTVLSETVKWLNQENISQWSLDDVSSEKLLVVYGNDEIFVGYHVDQPVCAVVIQHKDDIFWQGTNHENSLYLHKLAVTKEFRGSGLAVTLVEMVCQRASELGKHNVRLDCRTNPQKLCEFYSQPRLGFQHQGNIVVRNNSHSLYQKTL